MHRKLKTSVPKQTVSTCSFTVHCQPTISFQHQVPPCLQCYDVTNSLSLSLSTPVPNCPANHHASVSRLPVSANIRQAPLFLHITEPQVFNISSMWQLNQGHWLSKLDPPGSHANFSQFMATKPDPTRIIPGSHADCFSILRQLNLVTSRPFRVLMPNFLNSTSFLMATKPRSLPDPPGSHANLSAHSYNLQAWRQAQ